MRVAIALRDSNSSTGSSSGSGVPPSWTGSGTGPSGSSDAAIRLSWTGSGTGSGTGSCGAATGSGIASGSRTAARFVAEQGCERGIGLGFDDGVDGDAVGGADRVALGVELAMLVADRLRRARHRHPRSPSGSRPRAESTGPLRLPDRRARSGRRSCRPARASTSCACRCTRRREP